MEFVSRKLADIGEFFAKDLLSFAILLFLSMFLINHLASAQTRTRNTGTTSTKMKQKRFLEEKPTGRLNKQIKFQNDESSKNWQTDFGITATQKAISNGSQQDKDKTGYSFSLEPVYKINDQMSLKAYVSYEVNSKNELQSDFTDLLASFYFYKAQITPKITFRPYLTTTLPLSKDSKQRQQMNMGSGVGGTFAGRTKIGPGIFSAAAGISAQKYFHRYETALNNILNTSYYSAQQISSSWEHKSFGINGLFRHINSWNYEGTMKESFLHMQALSYMVTEKLSFSIGHTNTGNVLSPNQEEIDIKLVDSDSSTFFLSTNYVF